MTIARFGNTAVPWTVSWTSEEKQYVGVCPIIGVRALCQPSSPGEGKPLFAKPHGIRQRESIFKCLCDLCGKSMQLTSKISLSHARPNKTAAPGGTGILQTEPLLHRSCARESLKFCPSLKRDIEAGTLMIRLVTAHRTQYALMGLEYIHHYVPDYVPLPGDRIAGHAKVELLRWQDKDFDWLMRDH